MPTSQDDINLLVANGLDPNKYSFDAEGRVVETPSQIQTFSPPASIHASNSDIQGKPSPDKPLTTAAKSFGEAAPGAIGAGLGASLLTGALTGLTTSEGTPIAHAFPPWSELGVGLVGAGIGAFAANKARKLLEPQAWQQNVAESAQQNPKAAIAGELASIPLGGFKPGIKGPIALAKLLTPGMESSAVDIAALQNMGLSTGIGAAQPIAQSLVETGQLPSLGQVAMGAAQGAVFNEPNAIGRKLGFHPAPSIDPLHAQLLDVLAKQYQAQQAPKTSLAQQIDENALRIHKAQNLSSEPGIELQRESQLAQQLKEQGAGQFPKENIRAWNDILKQHFGKLRNVEIKEDGTITDLYPVKNPDGSVQKDADGKVVMERKPITGEAYTKRTMDALQRAFINVNPDKMNLDTLPHELQHIFIRDLETTPAGKKLMAKGEAAAIADPTFQAQLKENPDLTPHEYLTSESGLEFVRRTLANDQGQSPLKTWWKDTMAHLKTKYTQRATVGDFSRLLNYKMTYAGAHPSAELGIQGPVVHPSSGNLKKEELNKENSYESFLGKKMLEDRANLENKVKDEFMTISSRFSPAVEEYLNRNIDKIIGIVSKEDIEKLPRNLDFHRILAEAPDANANLPGYGTKVRPISDVLWQHISGWALRNTRNFKRLNRIDLATDELLKNKLGKQNQEESPLDRKTRGDALTKALSDLAYGPKSNLKEYMRLMHLQNNAMRIAEYHDSRDTATNPAIQEILDEQPSNLKEFEDKMNRIIAVGKSQSPLNQAESPLGGEQESLLGDPDYIQQWRIKNNKVAEGKYAQEYKLPQGMSYGDVYNASVNWPKDKVISLYNELVGLNPELKNISSSVENYKKDSRFTNIPIRDIIGGVGSKFKLDNIKYFVEELRGSGSNRREPWDHPSEGVGHITRPTKQNQAESPLGEPGSELNYDTREGETEGQRRLRIAQSLKGSYQITVQPDEVPGSGFVQVDEISPTGENPRSTSADKLRAEGVDIPSDAELKLLPRGRYGIEAAKKTLAMIKSGELKLDVPPKQNQAESPLGTPLNENKTPEDVFSYEQKLKGSAYALHDALRTGKALVRASALKEKFKDDPYAVKEIDSIIEEIKHGMGGNKKLNQAESPLGTPTPEPQASVDKAAREAGTEPKVPEFMQKGYPFTSKEFKKGSDVAYDLIHQGLKSDISGMFGRATHEDIDNVNKADALEDIYKPEKNKLNQEESPLNEKPERTKVKEAGGRTIYGSRRPQDKAAEIPGEQYFSGVKPTTLDKELGQQLGEFENEGGAVPPRNLRYLKYYQGTPKENQLASPLRPEIDKIKELPHPEAEGVAKALTNFYARKRAFTGLIANDATGKLLKHLNFLNPKELLTLDNKKMQNVVKYMHDVQDTGTSGIRLSTEEQQIMQEVKDNLQLSDAEKRKFPGLATKPSINLDNLPNIISRSALKTLLGKAGTPEHAKLISDWYDYYTNVLHLSRAEADKALTDLKRSFKSTEFTGNIAKQFSFIDKASNIGLPRSWREDNLIDIMARFNNRYARRLAYHEAIESAPTAVQDALNDTLEGVGAATPVRNVIEDVGGIRDFTEDKRTAALGLIRSAMLGPLTGSKDFVSNLTLGWQHQSPMQALISPVKAWSDMVNNIAESFKAGVNRHNISNFELGEGGIDDITSITRRLGDVLNVVQGRNWLERMSRATAFGQGKWLAMDNIYRARAGGLSAQGRKFLNDFGPENWYATYGKTGAFPPDVLREVAAKYVESVQGAYDYRGLPALAMKGSLAPYASLARWNIEKLNNFQKYVINPAKQGNITPLLMSTVGMLIGGEAVNQLVQTVTGRKERTPNAEELVALAKESPEEGGQLTEAIGYKLAGLASLSGYAGILGDITKLIYDKLEKNRPQTYGNPLLQGLDTAQQDIFNVIEAANKGDLNSFSDTMNMVLQDYFQAYRLALGQLSPEQRQQIERTNKFRDLKLYRQTHGLDVGDVSTDLPNPLLNTNEKKFKQTGDMQEAVDLFPDLIKKAIEDANGNPEVLVRNLRGLKENNYQTMPNPDSMPLTFRRYLMFLEQSQGSDKATERLLDYLRQNAVNKAKSDLVPSP